MIRLCSIAIAAALLGNPLQNAEVSSSIAVQPLTSAHPVLAADDRIHIPYELQVVNQSTILITIDRVEALDATGAKLDELSGKALDNRLRISGGETGRTFGPSHSGYIHMDVSLPRSSSVPAAIKHRISITRQVRAKPGDDHTGAPLPAGAPIEPSVSFIGAEVSVDQTPAITIAPPLRGAGWVVVNGCCDELNAHRGVILAINGALRVFERFAIDFVQLDSGNRLFTGDRASLSSYAFFGAPVYSVADGTVVRAGGDASDEIPGRTPRGITTATALGNFAIVDIGSGHSALYAHLQKGSLSVKVGDKVRAGDVLGRLGNTGNTDAPHLHFHIMDGQSNSLPFVFTTFTGSGVLTAIAPIFRGEPAKVDNMFAGPHPNRFPLNNQLVRFE